MLDAVREIFNFAAPTAAEPVPLSEAEQFLKDEGKKYQRQPDGTLLVDGELNLSGRGLTRLPDLSSVVVTGNFLCQDNQLTSLAGSPRAVRGFWCDNNRLTDLVGAPQTVQVNFFCGRNRLTSLKGAPEALEGTFHCVGNQLVTLEGGPQHVGKKYFCDHNRLLALEGAPATIEESFSCTGNRLATLEGAPFLFGKLFSDFGEYEAWADVPEALQVSPATRARQAQEAQEKKDKILAETVRNATVLQDPLTLQKPFRLKIPKTR